jgi:hypothetical protein
MKKSLLSAAIIVLLISGCTNEDKSPLEGTWRCISVGSIQFPDTGFQYVAENGMIKTFSKKYFTFVGHIDNDSVTLDEFGAGTYTLDGNKYEEFIIYHELKSLIGKRFKALDEIRNDTLIHRFNMDTVSSWQLGKGYVTEKFVRLK